MDEVTTDSGDGNQPLAAALTASASEPYRELIEWALSRGRNAMSIWQELVDRHGFTGGYESVKRYRPQTARNPIAGSACRHRDRAGRRSAGRLRRRPDGPRSANRQVPAHTAVRADARLQPQVASGCYVPFQRTHLGRTARAGLPPAGRSTPSRGASTTCEKACSRPISTIPR